MLAVVFGVGAPPSEFAASSSQWWSLEPLLFPALGDGVVLALAALVASLFRTSLGATLCLAAVGSTAIGTTVAAGISDHPSWRLLAMSVAFLVLPGLAAVHALLSGRAASGEADTQGQHAPVVLDGGSIEER
jgi:hypothetical protein